MHKRKIKLNFFLATMRESCKKSFLEGGIQVCTNGNEARADLLLHLEIIQIIFKSSVPIATKNPPCRRVKYYNQILYCEIVISVGCVTTISYLPLKSLTSPVTQMSFPSYSSSGVGLKFPRSVPK